MRIAALLSSALASCHLYGFAVLDDEGVGVVFGLFILVAGFLFYFLPCVVAGSRKVRSMAGIVLVNIFLGWTFLGWLVALIWAFSAETEAQAQLREMAFARMAYGPPPQPYPYPTDVSQMPSAAPNPTYNLGHAVGSTFAPREDGPPTIDGTNRLFPPQ